MSRRVPVARVAAALLAGSLVAACGPRKDAQEPPPVDSPGTVPAAAKRSGAPAPRTTGLLAAASLASDAATIRLRVFREVQRDPGPPRGAADPIVDSSRMLPLTDELARRVPESPGAGLLVPFAMVGDLVTSPLRLLLGAFGAGSSRPDLRREHEPWRGPITLSDRVHGTALVLPEQPRDGWRLGVRELARAGLTARDLWASAEDHAAAVWLPSVFAYTLADAKKHEGEPPRLVVESRGFTDDGLPALPPDGVLDAGETATLRLRVSNAGTGYAFGARLETTPGSPAIRAEVPSEGRAIALLEPGVVRELAVALVATASLADGTTQLALFLLDADGNASAPCVVPLRTARLRKPVLSLSRTAVVRDVASSFTSGNGDGKLDRGETAEIKVALANRGEGPAAVTLKIARVPEGLKALRALTTVDVLAAGQSQVVAFTLEWPREGPAPREAVLEVVAEDARGLSRVVQNVLVPLGK